MLAALLKSLWPARLILGVVIFVEVFAAAGVLPIETEFTWKGLLLQSIVILAVLEFMNMYAQKKRLDIAVGPGALILALQVATDATGDMAHFYGRFVWFDQLMHFTGGVPVSFFATGIYKALFEKQYEKPLPR